MTSKSEADLPTPSIEVLKRPRKWGIDPTRLAAQAATALGMEQDEQQLLIETALGFGRWMRHNHKGGYWDRLDIAEVVRWSRFKNREAREQFLFFATTLLGFAGLNGHLTPTVGRRYMSEIQQLSHNPATVSFAAATAGQFSTLIC